MMIQKKSKVKNFNINVRTEKKLNQVSALFRKLIDFKINCL